MGEKYDIYDSIAEGFIEKNDSVRGLFAKPSIPKPKQTVYSDYLSEQEKKKSTFVSSGEYISRWMTERGLPPTIHRGIASDEDIQTYDLLMKEAQSDYARKYGAGGVLRSAGAKGVEMLPLGSLVSPAIENREYRPEDFLYAGLDALLFGAPAAGKIVKGIGKAAAVAKPVARELALGQAGGVGKRVNKVFPQQFIATLKENTPDALTAQQNIAKARKAYQEGDIVALEELGLQDAADELLKQEIKQSLAELRKPKAVTPEVPMVRPGSPQAVTKEPWQMTRAEYAKWQLSQNEQRISEFRNAPYQRVGSIGIDAKTARKMHEIEVEQALSDGKPVPPEVLKDYPDLKALAETQARESFRATVAAQTAGQTETILQPSELMKRNALPPVAKPVLSTAEARKIAKMSQAELDAYNAKVAPVPGVQRVTPPPVVSGVELSEVARAAVEIPKEFQVYQGVGKGRQSNWFTPNLDEALKYAQRQTEGKRGSNPIIRIWDKRDIEKRISPQGKLSDLLEEGATSQYSYTHLNEIPYKEITLPQAKQPQIISPKQGIASKFIQEEGIEDLSGKPLNIDENGMVTLYHRTSKESASQMQKTGKFISLENTDETFFSNRPTGQAEGYGDSIVSVKVPAQDVVLNDAFKDEIHVTVSNKKLNRANIIQPQVPLSKVEPPSAIVPPVEPPKPPPPPTSIIGATPPSPQPGKVIMGDLQNADELVTVMNQPDVYRKIANLPAVRQVMSYLNPSGIAKTVPEKGVVARAALREEGANKAIGAFSNLETVGRREKIWGQLDDAGRLTQGELAGKPLDEVLTYRIKYTKDMTPKQAEWARTFHELGTEKLNLLRRNGIEINELSFLEGGEYVDRRVVGRINPLTKEIDEVAFIGTPGPGRPGARMGAEKHRYFKDINEAIEQGHRYLPPDEAQFLNIKGAYNRIADKQMADWVLERIPWRTSASPETLILARDVARDKMSTAIRLKSLLNRAVRGERVPLDESLVKSLPNETAELRSLIPELQKGGAVGDRVQALTAHLNDVVKTRKQEWREIADKLATAHEQALKTHLGEATVQAPAFSGKILTGTEAKQTAQTLNRAFSAQYGDLDRIVSGVNKVNSIGRYFMLAADASPMMIQLLTFTFRFPKIWAKSAVGFTKALFSPEAQARYLAKNNDIIQKSRNLILTKGGQTEFTEAFRSGGIMQSKWAKAPKAILEPFQRGFEGALDTAGIELRKAFDHLATTPQRTAQVEQFINEIRGVTSSARIGVSPHLRAAETATTLAPRYNRAIAALVSDIAQGGIRGDQARKALAALIGGGAALATAISLARGEGWEGVQDHLDITKPSRFVTWDVGGQNVGPGSKIRSLLVLLGKIIDDPNRIVDHANSFMRGNFSPVLSTGFDILAGKDYIGEPTRPGKSGFGRNVPFGEGMLGLTKRVVADNLIPIWLQSVALEGGDLGQRGIRGTAEFFGGRAYPVSTSRLYGDKWEDDLKDYLAIPSNDIELKAAQKTNRALVSRENYRIRHPEIDAKLFITGDVDTVKTLNAMNAALRLIQENKIDPKTIEGVARNLAEKEKKTKLGVRDTTVTPTDRLVSSLTKIQGISKTEPAQTPIQPSVITPQKTNPNADKWNQVKPDVSAAQWSALDKVWYKGGTLTPAEEDLLLNLFSKRSLGMTSFNTWLKTLKQYYESSLG